MPLSENEKRLQREISNGAYTTPTLPYEAISSLLILDSAYVGSRDLWWVDSPSATKGYSIYRAFDYPTNWSLLNDIPWPGHFYRDSTVITQKTVTIQPSDFLDAGEFGKWGFKLPETPYSKQVKGRPVVATSPDDVTVLLDGKPYRPVMVEGIDRSVWMKMDNTLPEGGAVSALALVNTLTTGTVTTNGTSTVAWASGSYFNPNWNLQIQILINEIPYIITSGSTSNPTTTTSLTVAPIPPSTSVPSPGIFSYSVGAVYKADYSGVQKWQVVFNVLTNYVDIYTTLTRTFYSVVPVGDTGEVHEPGAPGTPVVNTQEVDQLDYMQAAMVRYNEWGFEMFGEPALVMFRKTRGVPCGCKGTGLGQPRTGCPSCFEVGYVGGYYGPYDIVYIDPDAGTTRELDEGGIKVTREAKSYLTRTPIVQDGDLIIRRNGERLVINGVTYKSPRGVILQQDFNVTLLNRGDTRYLIPINTGRPTIFDPVVSENPLNGKGNSEPITEARTEPDKQWENPNPQPGRSISFGKIQR